jgi:hypothetical protein
MFSVYGSLSTHIRAASDGTLEAISARRNEHSVTPDEADELQAVIDEITAMNGEMSALYLATNGHSSSEYEVGPMTALVRYHRPQVWPKSAMLPNPRARNHCP